MIKHHIRGRTFGDFIFTADFYLTAIQAIIIRLQNNQSYRSPLCKHDKKSRKKKEI